MKKQIDIDDWNNIDKATQDKLISNGKFNIIPDAKILPNVMDMIDYLGEDWIHSIAYVYKIDIVRFSIGLYYQYEPKYLCDSLIKTVIYKINETN